MRAAVLAYAAGFALLAATLGGCSASHDVSAAEHAERHLVHQVPSGESASDVPPGFGYRGTTPRSALKVGDCVDDLTAAGYTTVFGLDVVVCTQPHDSEIYALPIISGSAAWPGASSIAREVDSECNLAFARYVGVPVEDTLLDYTFYPPSPVGWQSLSQRYAICVAYHDRGETTGSVRGTGLPGTLVGG